MDTDVKPSGLSMRTSEVSFSKVPLMRKLSARLLEHEPVLAGAAIVIILSVLPMVMAYAIDTRTLADINVWTKPIKFHISLFVYVLTLALYAAWLPAGLTQRRWYRIYRAVVLGCIVVELVCIGGAAAMGTASHFNVSNPLMENLYRLMGVAAVTLTSAALVFGILIGRHSQSSLSSPVRLSISLGLCLTFVLTVFVAGYMASGSTHLIGGNTSDAERLAVLGWSRDGGDLRVAHFFATHALHVIPALGWLAAKCLPVLVANLCIWVASVSYVALVAFTFIQATAGRAFAF